VSGDGPRVRPHRLTIDRAVIHCRERGSGDAVILLPAGGCRSDYLDPLAAALAAAGWRVIAIDLRGAGDSHGPAEDTVTLHTLAADVAAVIARLDAAPAHIIGHAFGNRVARCLAHDHPQQVRSLVLLACGGQVPPDAATQEAARQLVREDLDPAAWSDALRAVYLASGSDPALVEALGQTPAATRTQAAAHKATTDQDWQAGGTAPMLVLQGLEDRMAPVANGHVLRDRCGPRVQVIDIEGAGHLLPLEQPARVRDHILEFLTASGPQGR
jgi:pimeloyl-ACP methyl ester carboxylesterase